MTLEGSAEMRVEFSAGTTAENVYAGKISGTGSLALDLSDGPQRRLPSPETRILNVGDGKTETAFPRISARERRFFFRKFFVPVQLSLFL